MTFLVATIGVSLLIIFGSLWFEHNSKEDSSEWKEKFEEQWTAAEQVENNKNTTENIETYTLILETLPNDAIDEKNKVQQKIDHFKTILAEAERINERDRIEEEDDKERKKIEVLKPEEKVEQVAVVKPVQHNSGQDGSSAVTNINHPEPDPPFSFGGGGSGGQGGYGDGPGFGQCSGDPGPGGNGTGNGAARKVIKPPCKPEFDSEVGVIVLTVIVDETGRVVSATNVASKSTLSSTTAINAARRAVLDCMKYEARSGAPNTRQEVTVRMTTN